MKKIDAKDTVKPNGNINNLVSDFNNLVSLIRQLSWTYFIVLIPINIAEYVTEFLPKELLQKKSPKFYLENKNLIENRG